MDADRTPLPGNDPQLIAQLRQEAQEVKNCFTNFSYQAFLFTAAILGITSNYLENYFVTAIATTTVILFLLAVARIGTYKYGTANRNFGYQLHLESSHYLIPSAYGWQPHMRNIGWEEALRAWRVVQATVFKTIYLSRLWQPNWRRKAFRNSKPVWFQPDSMLGRGTRYHAGSYLREMLLILHSLTLVALILLLFGTVHFIGENRSFLAWPSLAAGGYFLLLLLLSVMRIVQNTVRRRILEGGLLCIHSCGIMWRAVTIAHFRALDKLARSGGRGYKGYVTLLSEQARELSRNLEKIHEWMGGAGEPAAPLRAPEGGRRSSPAR